ncbi:MAG: acetyltransferase [Syntrophomonas sp.]
MSKPVIVMGAGGHARVLLDILVLQRLELIGITSADPHEYEHRVFGLSVIGPDELIFAYPVDAVSLVNGLGLMPGRYQRLYLYEKFKQHGYGFLSVMHPSAVVASDVKIREGVQIMAGAIIQTGTVLDENSIINTGAVVDHDSYIGKHVHLAPGATVSGGVSIGERTFVGVGASIIQGIKIGVHCVVAAGAVVVRDLPDGARAMGIPARVTRGRGY